MEEKKRISEKEALSRMMRICSKKEYSTFDIKQKLYKLQLTSIEIDNIISKLTENKFISDERYTRSYISDKLRFSKWGIVKIRHHLNQKQISNSIIKNALEEIEIGSITEHLMPIIEQKMKSVKGNTEYEKRAKVIRFALGRGFEMPDIIKCIDKISTTEEDLTW